MRNNIEYMKLFMEFESDDMPMVYFYEVDLNDNRFMFRQIEVFADRTVKVDNAPCLEVIEACPIPTADEFNAKVYGEGFYATVISKKEFDEIWKSHSYSGSLTAT